MKETHLYLPVKRLLESQGYEVKAEVRNCDVVAIRGDEEPVVVELKLTLNLTVVLQAVERLAITSKVYVGVPKHCSVLKRRHRPIIKLLRRLGLGLLAIDPDSNEPNSKRAAVKVLLDPGDYRPRVSKKHKERLLGEVDKRGGDPNLGGAAMRNGIVTAYRQQATVIAEFLRDNGPTKASEIALAVKIPAARTIMYRNVYGWFERESLGVYCLSPRGQRELQERSEDKQSTA